MPTLTEDDVINALTEAVVTYEPGANEPDSRPTVESKKPGRPKIVQQGKRLHVLLDEEALAKFDAACEKLDRSRSDLIRELIDAFVHTHELGGNMDEGDAEAA